MVKELNDKEYRAKMLKEAKIIAGIESSLSEKIMKLKEKINKSTFDYPKQSKKETEFYHRLQIIALELLEPKIKQAVKRLKENVRKRFASMQTEEAREDRIACKLLNDLYIKPTEEEIDKIFGKDLI